MKLHLSLLLFVGMNYYCNVTANIFYNHRDNDKQKAKNALFTMENIVVQKGFAQILLAKASAALKVVPDAEQRLFLQCARNGKTSQSVAKCLDQLFEARDNAIRRKNDASVDGHHEQTMASSAAAGEQGIVPATIEWLKQMVFDPLSKLTKSQENNFKALDKEETKIENARRRHLKKLELTFKQYHRKMKRRRRREIVKKKTLYAKMAKHQIKKLSNLEKIDRIRTFQQKFVHYSENIAKYNEMRKSITEAYQLKQADFVQNRSKKHIENGSMKQQMNAPQQRHSKKFNQPKNNARYFSPRIFSLVPPSPTRAGGGISSSNTNSLKQNANANATNNIDTSVSFMSPELLRLYEDEDDLDDNNFDKKFGVNKNNNNNNGSSSITQMHNNNNNNNNNNKTLEQLVSSVPNLLRLMTPDKAKRRKFFDNILSALNVGQTLDQILEPITLLSDTLDKGLLNMSTMLRESMEVLVQLKDSMTTAQHNYYLDKGYTFLSEKQMQIVNTGKVQSGIKRHVLSKLSGTKFKIAAEQMEDEIERYIREKAMANSELTPKQKRAAFNTKTEEIVPKRQKRNNLPIDGPVYGVLSPFAFVPQVNSLQLYTLYVLSPQAFIPSYMNPAVFYMQMLSPWAFLANLFSPQFISCLCLSPTAFEANLLSPQAISLELLSPTMFQANLLNPYMLDLVVLSPEAFIADLLSPQLIQPKILSSQYYTAGVLSPPIASPSYFSDEAYTLMILSPEIYSPNINSKVKDAIMIFSPEIAGGHDESEFETEGENVIYWPKGTEPKEEAYLGENSAHPDTDVHFHPNIIHP